MPVYPCVCPYARMPVCPYARMPVCPYAVYPCVCPCARVPCIRACMHVCTCGTCARACAGHLPWHLLLLRCLPTPRRACGDRSWVQGWREGERQEHDSGFKWLTNRGSNAADVEQGAGERCPFAPCHTVCSIWVASCGVLILIGWQLVQVSAVLRALDALERDRGGLMRQPGRIPLVLLNPLLNPKVEASFLQVNAYMYATLLSQWSTLA